MIAFDNPTREIPIRSAKSVCVIRLSLRISAILNSLSIIVNLLFHSANIQIKQKVYKLPAIDKKKLSKHLYV
nr:MAG TPA: hypothetical protein [Caudoviricetes sp.]